MKKKISFLKEVLSGKEEYDFTTIDLNKAILLLAIPMVLELVLESVFALVDLYFVGHLENSNLAIQIIGLTESVNTIIYSISIGLSVAATAIVSRRVGEKKPKKAGKVAMQSIFIALVISLFVSVLGVVYAEELFTFLGASAESRAYGILYPKIIFASSCFIILIFLINGIFRGIGNPALAMKSLWFANICNIILCPILINGWGVIPAMGIVGAALATAIGRALGVFYQLYFLFFRVHLVTIKIRYIIPKFDLIAALIKVATPGIMQYVIASCSWIFLSQIVAKTGGENGSSGFQTAIRIMMFFMLPAWGLSNATATLVGLNLGAKNKERVREAVVLTAKYSMIFLGCSMTLCLVFGEAMIRFFTNDEYIIEIAYSALKIVSYGYLFYGVGMVLNNVFNGAGDTMTPTWINLIGFWVIQIPLAYLLSYIFKLDALGVFIAIPIAEALITIMSVIMYRRGKWINMKV
ncbi:MATE family efflux transporter [Flavobacterium sp.]|uniref:MATE family efflux transporter n=1 Tax=Flavobacterium sp. TaxID=239 RepID=UPI004048C4F7